MAGTVIATLAHFVINLFSKVEHYGSAKEIDVLSISVTLLCKMKSGNVHRLLWKEVRSGICFVVDHRRRCCNRTKSILRIGGYAPTILRF
jgi:hypothetical protein